jgi:hypothetical protein
VALLANADGKHRSLRRRVAALAADRGTADSPAGAAERNPARQRPDAVDAHGLLARLKASLLARDGLVRIGPVVWVDRSAGRVRGVSLSDGSHLAAAHVILAGGVHTQSLPPGYPSSRAGSLRW